MSARPEGQVQVEAATVLLVRDGADGLEVFMVLRHHAIDSFSNALVFPGGKLDPGDGDSRVRRHTRRTDHLDDEALRFRVAAIREAFEECGVLYASKRGVDELLSEAEVAPLREKYLKAVLNDEISMHELCAAEDLELRAGQLAHYAHWVTPTTQPKIFDTHFFIGAAPADQHAVHDGEESTESVWIRPAEAVEDAQGGRRTIVFPTMMNLRRLATFDSVAAVLEAARTWTVVRVQPTLSPHERGRTLTIPAEAGYGVSQVLVGKDGKVAEVLA
ncbi:MAG: NUDIX domain-containing protein [Alphaproteobacteria bacterium]